MKAVRDVLKTKGSDVCSVTPETTVYDALKLMAEKNIGAVLVLERERLVAIFSERDYARQVILKGKTSKDTPVHEVMTSRVVLPPAPASLAYESGHHARRRLPSRARPFAPPP